MPWATEVVQLRAAVRVEAVGVGQPLLAHEQEYQQRHQQHTLIESRLFDHGRFILVGVADVDGDRIQMGDDVGGGCLGQVPFAGFHIDGEAVGLDRAVDAAEPDLVDARPLRLLRCDGRYELARHRSSTRMPPHDRSPAALPGRRGQDTPGLGKKPYCSPLAGT